MWNFSSVFNMRPLVVIWRISMLQLDAECVGILEGALHNLIYDFHAGSPVHVL
jgi:hypothetical protein